ncbi:immediate early protein [Plasmodium yoelii]|uniref:Lysophospholipase n=3 Tax=Plasmodium yoelii TaxID=5861 RepID=A0AAE9WVH8_PLAYO|nr:immediate early protein [Plasmodium yoelii]EAA21422.1 immediate early protein homolog-related [Plasmodium yoelii yoelii]WBY59244.1 lysophospholipase [Plasmodium yoelii yoelii]CDU19400.1 lysophospholipase, putative [Plasmodium yoelii]VTZ80035.1 lysophospholipase, putative [Plasmodium yoelii]|eukprot:XP_729857.1 immediate early protein [Plasmodium yoelii]
MELSQEERQEAAHMLNSGNVDPSIMGDPDIGFFTNKNGLRIKTLRWLVKAPIGAVVLVHSLNSHCRFDYLKHNAIILNNDKAVLNDGDNYYVHKDSWIEELNKNGYSVYGLDLQGHGESESLNNVKTHINRFDDFSDDMLQYLNIIHDSIVNEFDKNYQENDNDSDTNKIKPRKRCTKCDLILKDEFDICCIKDEEIIKRGLRLRNPEKNQYKRPDYNIDAYKTPIPIYLVGLSMGGNIVLRVLELLSQKKYNFYNRINIKGVCSLSGMVSVNQLKKKAAWKYFYIPTVGLVSHLFPKSRFMPSLPCESFPFLNDLYAYDKIFYHKPITNKFAYKLLEAVENLNKDINKITDDVPILFIHSVNDQKCCYDDVQDFYNNLKSINKEFHVLEDMEHMITIEPGNDKIVKKIIDWISSIENEPKEKKKTKKKAKKKNKQNLRSTVKKQQATNESCASTDAGVPTDYSNGTTVQGQDVQEQDVQEQDVQEQDVQEQDVLEEDVQYQDVQEQDVQYQDVQEQDLQYQDVQEQDVQEQDVQYQDVQYQDVQEQDVQEQDVQEQDVQEQDVQEQDVQEQDVQEQDVQEQAMVDGAASEVA